VNSEATFKDYVLPYLITLCALAVSGTAAFYSVTGLSKLFAGASVAILIMAGSLEVSKLVIASLLYRYWGELNKVLKYYLTVATIILVLITSLGIYGFLTAAYQTTADELVVVENRIKVEELQKQRLEGQLQLYIGQQRQVSEAITSLTGGLATGTTVQYVDATGQLVTTTSSSARRTLESQINTAVTQRDRLSSEITTVSDSIAAIDQRVLSIKQGSEVSGEVGPLRFLSEISGIPMNSVVNIFTLIIIFVFDPLAVSLVLAANFAFMRLKKKEQVVVIKEPQYIETAGGDDAIELELPKELSEETKVELPYEESALDVEQVQKLEEQQEVIEEQKPEEIVKVLQYTPSNVSILTDSGTRKKISKEEYKNYKENKFSKRYF